MPSASMRRSRRFPFTRFKSTDSSTQIYGGRCPWRQRAPRFDTRVAAAARLRRFAFVARREGKSHPGALGAGAVVPSLACSIKSI
jgi:hypothetical protein